MKRILTALAAACAVLSIGLAQTTDPAKAYSDILKWRADQLKSARESGAKVDLAALEKQFAAKAEEAIKGVDVAKVDAKQALDWARLFDILKRSKDVCDLCQKYLTTSPDATNKYLAQSLMLRSCNALEEADMMLMTLADIKPDTKNSAVSLASSTANIYVDTIAKKKDKNAALKALDMVEKMVPYAEFTTDQEKSMAEVTRANIAQSRCDLLLGMGKRKEAVAALDAAIGAIDPKSAQVRRLNASRTQLTLVDSPSPALPAEKSIGEFKGLEAYKGKVVILDFFAHWCGPCIRSFPDMKSLFGDLHGKGLEVFGVTSYYGYYKSENVKDRDMPKDIEFAKMGEFVKEYELPWPVVYTEKTNYASFGISGIPHVVVIDKEGVVRKIHVGYSPESFKELREFVEKLVKG